MKPLSLTRVLRSRTAVWATLDSLWQPHPVLLPSYKPHTLTKAWHLFTY